MFNAFFCLFFNAFVLYIKKGNLPFRAAIKPIDVVVYIDAIAIRHPT